jgi:hypothetical protein
MYLHLYIFNFVYFYVYLLSYFIPTTLYTSTKLSHIYLPTYPITYLVYIY